MSNTTTRSQNLPTVDRVRLGVVRTIAVGLLASGALVVFAGAASAKPIVPDLDIDDITVATLPPVTIPPKTIPPSPSRRSSSTRVHRPLCRPRSRRSS